MWKLLLNEKNEILALLDGKRMNKKYTYRSCYLLAKYFKSLDYDMIKTREEIFVWANKYKIYITDDLNSIIQKVFNDKFPIVDDICIFINNNDIEEINKRFDKQNTKLTAFAILCFAKKYANKDGIFQMSLVGLSNWINIHQTQISGRIIKELIDFQYIEKINKNKFLRIIRKKHSITYPIIYKINVKLDNNGEYIFKDENIREEYKNIFALYDTNSSITNNICE